MPLDVARHVAPPVPLLPWPRALLTATTLVLLLSVVLLLEAAGRCDPRVSSCDPLLRAALRTATFINAHPGAARAAIAGSARLPLTLAGVGCALTFLVLRRPRGAVFSLLGPWAAVLVDERVGKPVFGGSFPSGHAAALFSVAAVMTLLLSTTSWPSGPARWPVRALPAVVAWTMSSTLIVTGVHPPVDIVGGACVGVGVVLLAALSIDAAAFGLTALTRRRPASGPFDVART